MSSSKIKKVYLNGRFLTQPITGVQRTAYELVLALDELIDEGCIPVDAHAFTLIYSGKIINPITLKHIKLVKTGLLKGNLWEQLELPFYTAGNLLVSMCTISSLLKRKQMVFVHDASFIVNPSFFTFTFRTWYKIAITALGKIAKQLVTVSEFSKSELIKYAGFKRDKITVIYNAAGHILRYNDPDEAFKQKINALKPYCLAVSSLSANKNFMNLSRAIDKIDFRGYNMLIAGGAMTTLQHSAGVSAAIYLGYVSNAELKYLYANASLFIFPSFYEGFGIPPLEAMVSGCPVLSSNTSSLPEVLGDACSYFDPQDVDDIAEKISAALNSDHKLKELKLKGYQRAALYSWKKSALQLYTLISTL